MSGSLEDIDRIVKENTVVLFMKGTPEFPMCGFSARCVGILKHLDATYKSVDVFDNPDIRQNIKVYSEWPTIPQLYVNGEFVGGADIMMEMFQSGELQALLADAEAAEPNNGKA